ncbi:dipeptidase [Pseudahrensia aquimaris]|uniref:Dipeptidase n=1 Tax=Pseudahrensia aquimaris TaxID=744461 RepID=A0ABW3F9Y5_9HYPH
MTDPVLAHLRSDADAILQRLIDYAQIPSVSTDPAYSNGMAQARALLVQRLTDAGFDDVQTIHAGGHPAVFAQWIHATDAPTYLVYGHYDVQPPDPLDKWHSAPFEPQIRNGRLYGRGVSDDKGPASIALEVLFAFLKVEGRLPINIKILLEGEEEIGSASLPKLLRDNANLLRAEAVISADGARWRADLPSVNTGSRGNMAMEVTLKTASKDLHSGRFGGAVPNAAHVLARLVASLHKDDGSVAVPGFYEGIEEVDEALRSQIADLPFDEDSFFAGIGSVAFGEANFSTLERLWLRPTLEINGMGAGYAGEGGKTITPAEAFAKITTRLVPGQKPAEIAQAVRHHLEQACPDSAEMEFRAHDEGNPAYSVPADLPLLHAVEGAIEQALGKKPVRVRVGSTLPLSAMIKEALGMETVTLSFSTADEDFHAPNEFFRLSAIDEGTAAWVALLRSLENS